LRVPFETLAVMERALKDTNKIGANPCASIAPYGCITDSARVRAFTAHAWTSSPPHSPLTAAEEREIATSGRNGGTPPEPRGMSTCLA